LKCQVRPSSIFNTRRVMCHFCGETNGESLSIIAICFCAEIMLKLGARTFILPPPFKLPRTFKSHTYAIKPICTYSIAQDLFTAIFESRKDVKLTKLFKIDHRVVYRGRKADFYYFESRPKIACNFIKNIYFENPKTASDSS
jgi:hypothetical protein